MHVTTGETITICNRLLAAVILLGSLFCLMLLASLQLARNPEEVLKLQAFAFNYNEFASLNRQEAQEQVLISANRKHFPPKGAEPVEDPNWDGMLAGAGLGFTLARGLPFIGPVAGPVVGAVIGYRLDSRI
jgi:hypothetical protein